MNWFLVVGGIVLLGVLVALLYPLLNSRVSDSSGSAGQRELNLLVLREQSQELERDLKEGRISKESYAQSRNELERRTLDCAAEVAPVSQSGGRKTILAVVLAIAFPAVVGSLYWMLGAPDSVAPAATTTAGKAGEHALTPQQISEMVGRLALRLQENPEDGAGWLMLARSYAVLGRFPESSAAFGRAVTLLPPDAQNYADFADILAMGQGKKLTGEPEKLVQRALEIDSRNVKALALSGTIAFDHQDYPRAIREWRKVLALLPEESGAVGGIQGSIRDAENRMAISGQKIEEVRQVSEQKQTTLPAKVTGVVELDPKLRASMKPGETLFIFARALNGPKMPVAMLRGKANELPLQFVLDDSLAMTPQFKLSNAGTVVVGARISKSGDALARTGDLEGLSVPVVAGASNVKIIINTVVQ